MATRPETHLGLRYAVLLAAASTLGGLVLLANGMTRLRYAYHYRQQTGEGLVFFWVAVELLAASAIAATGSVVLATLARRVDDRYRRPTIAIAAAVIFTIVACGVGAAWVEGQGIRCIGPCG